MTPQTINSEKGHAQGALSYVLWGILPLFWWLLREVSATEVLCHRILWSGGILCIWFIFKGDISVLSNLGKKELARYVISAFILSINWLTYIWAVSNGYVLASSLGYFLAPLLYIAAGFYVLKENLTAYQRISIFFCFAAFIILLYSSDITTIAVAFLLAGSIVLYGFLRKRGTLKSDQGLFIESLVLLPFAFLWLSFSPDKHFLLSSYDSKILLALSGPVTLVPLLLYCSAVSRVSLTTIGYPQYISPILQFLLGLYFFNESLSSERLFAFILVWCGIACVLCEKIKFIRPAIQEAA